MKLSEKLAQDHASGDFGLGLEEYAEKAKQLEDENVVLRIKRDAIIAAIHEYYAALDNRQHGAIAQDRAFNKITQILNMPWVRGATLKKDEA